MTRPLLCAIIKIKKHDRREKMDQIINHAVLSLDFWQDTVNYEGCTMPTGTIGCEVLNIPDSTTGYSLQCAEPATSGDEHRFRGYGAAAAGAAGRWRDHLLFAGYTTLLPTESKLF